MKLPFTVKQPPAPEEPSPSPVHAQSLFDLAVEIWRLQQRIDRLKLSAESRAGFARSMKRNYALLADIGIEVRDPVGTEYHEGLSFDILSFDTRSGQPIIEETIRPAVYFKGQLVMMARVIVGSKPVEE